MMNDKDLTHVIRMVEELTDDQKLALKALMRPGDCPPASEGLDEVAKMVTQVIVTRWSDGLPPFYLKEHDHKVFLCVDVDHKGDKRLLPVAQLLDQNDVLAMFAPKPELPTGMYL